MAKKFRQEFSVWPKGVYSDFPVDMLRYDGAFPATERDSSRITDTLDGYVEDRSPSEPVDLIRYVEALEGPTVGRWSSFGWEVKVESVRTVNLNTEREIPTSRLTWRT